MGDYVLNFVMDDVVQRKLEFVCSVYGVNKSSMIRVAIHRLFEDVVGGVPDKYIEFLVGDVVGGE